MTILNLGCGTKASPLAINIDWSLYLRIRRRPLLSKLAAAALSNERRAKMESLPKNIVCHDLRRGIPYPDNSADAVYHSHIFEHLDRAYANGFLLEIKRVLKPGGIHRIVVPDFERLAASYLDNLQDCLNGAANPDGHDRFVSLMIEQLVRRQAYATRHKSPFQRLLETLVAGDAAGRGETHRWMYDRINLPALLEESGFSEITIQSFQQSQIANWDAIGLDRNEAGQEYQRGSLYVEAVKPKPVASNHHP